MGAGDDPAAQAERDAADEPEHDVRRLLSTLDGPQIAAVTSPSPLTAVIATAGSGKTRVLTARVAFRVLVGTADAHHTLALTFTREAAGELRRRLRRTGLGEPVEAGTFHSVALSLLRQRWSDTDRRAPAIISDPGRLLREIAEGQDVGVLVAEQSWMAARGVRPSGYAAAAQAAGRRRGNDAEAIAAALDRYVTTKRRRGVIDLDDLIAILADELARDQAFAAATRWRFRHIHVDEAQDLNPAQFRLLDLLLGERRDLFMVGDPAQAIYGFNGADSRFLLDLHRYFPGVEVIRLDTNHRSTPEIVATGVQVLHNGGIHSPVRSDRQRGADVEFIVGDDEDDEATKVAVAVRALGRIAVEEGEVAVLARTHEQLGRLRAELLGAGVSVRAEALSARSPLNTALNEAAVLTSATALRSWAHDVLDTPPDPLVKTLEPAEQATRRVGAAVLQYLRESPLGNGAGLRSWVATTHPFAEFDDRRGVELLTFHAAKGREWSTVVVTGVETGLVPHRSATTVDAKVEECRLLHVAVTRARDRLIIARAETRRGYRRKPSPYLDGVAEVAVHDDVELTHERIHELLPHLAELAPGSTLARTEALKRWRATAAATAGTLPEQVCSLDDLTAIAEADPHSVDELAAVGSFGPVTAARFLPAIRSALDAAG